VRRADVNDTAVTKQQAHVRLDRQYQSPRAGQTWMYFRSLAIACAIASMHESSAMYTRHKQAMRCKAGQPDSRSSILRVEGARVDARQRGTQNGWLTEVAPSHDDLFDRAGREQQLADGRQAVHAARRQL
jgi:hypothetical protein